MGSGAHGRGSGIRARGARWVPPWQSPRRTPSTAHPGGRRGNATTRIRPHDAAHIPTPPPPFHSAGSASSAGINRGDPAAGAIDRVVASDPEVSARARGGLTGRRMRGQDVRARAASQDGEAREDELDRQPASGPTTRPTPHYFVESAESMSSTLKNASAGISTEPIIFMRFLPFFCFSSSLRLREMSPP